MEVWDIVNEDYKKLVIFDACCHYEVNSISWGFEHDRRWLYTSYHTQDEYYIPDEVVVIGGDYIHPTTLKMSITPPMK